MAVSVAGRTDYALRPHPPAPSPAKLERGRHLRWVFLFLPPLHFVERGPGGEVSERRPLRPARSSAGLLAPLVAGTANLRHNTTPQNMPYPSPLPSPPSSSLHD